MIIEDGVFGSYVIAHHVTECIMFTFFAIDDDCTRYIINLDMYYLGVALTYLVHIHALLGWLPPRVISVSAY